jgi:hypothetical protein
MSWPKEVPFWWDDYDVHFVLDQHDWLDFYSAGSMKQQSVCRYIAPLGHIIPIPSQTVFALITYWHVLSGEAANTNL